MTTQPPERAPLDRLRASVGRLGIRGVRAGGAPIARWLMIAGGLLMTLGLMFIVLGWIGASHTPYVFEQLPYVISGGLLGVAMAILGGLLYFSYWTTRTLEQSRTEGEATREALMRIEALLVAAGGVSSNGAAVRAAPARAPTRKPFVKTARGTMFHRPDCVVVAEKSGLVSVAETGESFDPCGICTPLASV